MAPASDPRAGEGASGERGRYALAVAGALGLLAALGHPLLTGEVYTHDDLGALHLPLRDFYANCLSEGKRFLWMPGWLTGFHLHGEGQAGMLHPLNFLFYRLFPLAFAFVLELLRNHVVAFVGMLWFLRRTGLPRDAAALGALAFGFSSYSFAHHMHLNAMGVVAHVPWLMGAADGVLRGEGRARLVSLCGVALLTASTLMLGHPQFSWIALLTTGLYAASVALHTRRPAAAASLAAAVALGVLCAGVQLVPTLESLGASSRSTAAPGYASTLALQPVNLLQLVSPRLFLDLGVGEPGNEFAIQPGVFAPLAFVWLWLRRRQLGSLGPLALFSGVLAVLGLWLALGDVAGLHRLLASLPGVGLLRAPTRYAVLFVVACALASALCLADIARLGAVGTERLPKRLWLLGLPLSLAVVVAALALAGHGPSAALSGNGAILGGCVLAAAALGLLFAALRGRRGALAAIVALVVLDLGSYGLAYVWRVPPVAPQEYASQWRAPAPLGDARLNWGPPAMVMAGTRLASGYAALTPSRSLPVGRFDLPGGRRRALLPALRLAGVGWAYDRAVPDPLPRARMLPSALRIDDLDRQLAEVDLRRVVLVGEALSLGPGGEPGDAELVVDEPGEIEIRTSAATRQMLVVSESHHPGWVASVDGERCEVVSAYGDFLGCVVPQGRHHVVFRFEPRSLRQGAWLSAAGLAGVALLVALAWRREEEPSASP